MTLSSAEWAAKRGDVYRRRAMAAARSAWRWRELCRILARELALSQFRPDVMQLAREIAAQNWTEREVGYLLAIVRSGAREAR